MSIVLYALAAFGVFLAVVFAIAATKPPQFRVERTLSMKAAPERPFALINDFRKWTQWSPWENVDADLKRTYSGTEAGVGTKYAWEGKKAGAGTMEITESTSPSKIVLALHFTKPFPANNITEFTLTQAGDETTVVWVMYGPSSLMHRVMSIFMNMDALIGKDFEKGLAAMKQAAEASS